MVRIVMRAYAIEAAGVVVLVVVAYVGVAVGRRLLAVMICRTTISFRDLMRAHSHDVRI